MFYESAPGNYAYGQKDIYFTFHLFINFFAFEKIKGDAPNCISARRCPLFRHIRTSMQLFRVLLKEVIYDNFIILHCLPMSHKRTLGLYGCDAQNCMTNLHFYTIVLCSHMRSK